MSVHLGVKGGPREARPFAQGHKVSRLPLPGLCHQPWPFPRLAPSPAGLQLLLHVGRTELSSPAGFLLPPWRLPVPLLLWQALPTASSDAAHSSRAWGAVLSSQGSFPRLLIPARPSERPEEPQAGQAGACTGVLVAGLQASCRACLLSPLAHLLSEDKKDISGLVAAGGCRCGLCCCCFRGSSPPEPQEGHHS